MIEQKYVLSYIKNNCFIFNFNVYSNNVYMVDNYVKTLDFNLFRDDNNFNIVKKLFYSNKNEFNADLKDKVVNLFESSDKTKKVQIIFYSDQIEYTKERFNVIFNKVFNLLNIDLNDRNVVDTYNVAYLKKDDLFVKINYDDVFYISEFQQFSFKNLITNLCAYAEIEIIYKSAKTFIELVSNVNKLARIQKIIYKEYITINLHHI